MSKEKSYGLQLSARQLLENERKQGCLSPWGRDSPWSMQLSHPGQKTFYPSRYTTRYMIYIDYHAIFFILDLGLAPKNGVQHQSRANTRSEMKNTVLLCLYHTCIPKIISRDFLIAWHYIFHKYKSKLILFYFLDYVRFVELFDKVLTIDCYNGCKRSFHIFSGITECIK